MEIFITHTTYIYIFTFHKYHKNPKNWKWLISWYIFSRGADFLWPGIFPGRGSLLRRLSVSLCTENNLNEIQNTFIHCLYQCFSTFIWWRQNLEEPHSKMWKTIPTVLHNTTTSTHVIPNFTGYLFSQSKYTFANWYLLVLHCFSSPSVSLHLSANVTPVLTDRGRRRGKQGCCAGIWCPPYYLMTSLVVRTLAPGRF